jgi:HK97 family phage portal protein
MQFNFNKMFTGARSKSMQSIAIEEIGKIFSGNSGIWGKNNELEQYSKSLYVFAAVNKIATKVAAIDFQLNRIKGKTGDSEEIFSHEILDLLTKVNPFQTRTEFLKTAWINKKLTGEAFWWKVRNNRGDVMELWNLRPDLMTVISDQTKYIHHYELQKSDGKIESFLPEDIIHFKDPDPTNPFRGMSPLQPAKTRIETEQSATSFQRDFFKNNARPDALLMTEETLDTEQRTQMTSSWDEEHRGKANNSKIGLLEGGMKYQQVSISQREMDYIESLKFTRDDILVALGVPKSIVTTDEVNYANADAGIRMFLSETIAPEMKQLVEVLDEFLVSPDFGEEYFLSFTDPTPADRASERADHTAGFGKWLTTNEIRENLNLPAIEGGDVIAAVQTINPNQLPGDMNAANQLALRSRSLKILRGRPMLRQKFELIDQVKAELTKQTTLSIAKHREQTKKNKDLKTAGKKIQKTKKEFVTLFPEQDKRNMYYDLVNKRLDKRAKTFAQSLVQASAKQCDRVITKLQSVDDKSLDEKALHEKVSHIDIQALLDKAGESKLFSSIALPFLIDYAEEGGKDAAKLTGETFTMTSKLRDSMEKRSAFFASAVTDTTFNSLVETLTQGINAGEGIGALTERVQGVYDEYPKWRAATIARTETTNANNEGAMNQYSDSAVVEGKEWIATMDDRTRDSHAEQDGEIVGVDALFSNGLMYPGDGFGDPSETINCRCALAPALFE